MADDQFDFSDPALQQAVQEQESQNDPNAVSKAGAVGLMGTMPATLRNPGYGVQPAKDDSDAERQRVGRDYLSAMGKKYGDKNLSLMAYNAGPGKIDAWIASGGDPKDLPTETRDYPQQVLSRYQKLKGPSTYQVAQTTPAGYETTTQTAQPAPQEMDPLDARAAEADKIFLPPTSGAVPSEEDPLDARARETSTKNSGSSSSTNATGNPATPTDARSKFESDLSNANNALSSGFGRGLRDVGETVGNAEAWAGNKLGLINDQDLQTAHEMQGQRKQTSDNQFKDNGFYTTGKIGGQVAGATPFIVAGGAALGAGATALGGAVPALEGPLNFLTGQIGSDAVANGAGQVIQPATWANRAARLASTVPVGATGGAAANALTGNDPVEGAEIGAVAGPATSLVGNALGAIFNKSEKLSPYTAKLQQALIRDGYTDPKGALDVGAVQNKLTQLGPDATLADVGPNTRDLTGAVAQTPGPGKDIISGALEDRQAGQSDRLKQSVFSGLGLSPADTYESAVPKLIQQRQDAATPIYQDAYGANKSMMTPEISRILRTPAGKAALKDAVTTMQNSRELVGVSDPDLVEQAALTGQEPTGDGVAAGLKLKTLDQVKQALWDAGESAKNKFGKPTAQSNAIHGLRNDLTSELDNADSTAIKDAKGNVTTPGKYAQARAAFAGPSQSLDALDAGTEFIKNGGSENANQLANLSPADRQFFRIGAAKQIRDTIHNTPDGADAVKRIFNSPSKREALQSIFPDKASFDNFSNTAQNEAEFYRTKGGIMGNSLTNPRIQSSADLSVPTKVQKVVNAAAGIGNFGIEMATRNNAGRALYFANHLKNKLMQPGVLSPEDTAELAHALITPEGRKSAIAALTPASQKNNDLLGGYIKALHNNGIAAISSSQNQK